MTNYRFFLILTCMTCLFYISCEKTGLQTTSNNDNKPIQTRGDCDECPGVDECCCAVWLDDDYNAADLRFCGTSDGASACSGVSYCGTAFSGGGQQLNLSDPNERKKTFCMNQGSPFYVVNYSSSPTGIIISCQDGFANPDTVHRKIQGLDTFYFETNALCELAPCP